MKESIFIKNLGPLKDICIDEIKPLTILIGESASGKSTLMKTLSLFRWIYKMQNIRSYWVLSNITSPFDLNIDDCFKSSEIDEFVTNETLIIYKTTLNSGASYEFKYENEELTLAPLIGEADICFNKISFVSETRNFIPVWAERGASSAGTYLNYYFHEVFDDFEIALAAIPKIALEHLNLEFLVTKSGNKKEYKIKSNDNGGYEIEFKNSSSGTISSAPILLISEFFSSKFDFREAFDRSVLKYASLTDNLKNFKPISNLGDLKKKLYMHIEEPELSLFPDAQCKLMEGLIANCFIKNTNEIELFISTHSPYIINYLNLLIKAYDKNSAGVKYNYDNLAVYQTKDGVLIDLMIQNERLVNTNLLSDTINDIYDQYNALN